MNLDELKQRREQNIRLHKEKKKAYYLKKKLATNSGVTEEKHQFIDYEKELFGGDLLSFTAKIKEIAKKQKTYIQDREEIIVAKIEEYRNKKKDYYLENKDKRLQYDKDYRIKKKEDLKNYRKEYYERNKDKILAKQREHRLKLKETDS
ncbi:MAG: hypothetical protein PHF17_09595 [Arcobacteraceae bacterium]|jgi:hypothetical protein|nr:hypothetical protein [Arcobacteraceae bacterium]